MPSCATQIAQPSSTLSSSGSSSGTTTSSTTHPSHTSGQSNASSSPNVPTSHLILEPLGLSGLLLAVVAARFYTPGESAMEKGRAILMTSMSLGVGALACSIAGIATSFKKVGPMLRKRSTSDRFSVDNHHGLVGIVLFVCLYGSLIFGAFITLLWLRSSHTRQDEAYGDSEKTEHKHSQSFSGTQSPRASSMEPSQGDRTSAIYLRGRTQSAGESSRMASPFPLLQGGSGGRSESDERLSTESEPPTTRGFEVVNRPKHLRSHSTHLTPEGGRAIPRTLSDLSWLDRRRSLNAIVGLLA